MAKPFDATLNSLIDTRPADWVAFLAPRLGLTPGPAEVLDTDLSVTAQADKVFRLTGPPAALIHLELEANPRRGIPADLLRYNVLVGHGHTDPVHTVMLLLCPKANATDLTGVFSGPAFGEGQDSAFLGDDDRGDADGLEPVRLRHEHIHDLWVGPDRKSTRLNSSHSDLSRMPSSA